MIPGINSISQYAKSKKSTQLSNKLGVLIPNYNISPDLSFNQDQKLNKSFSPGTNTIDFVLII